MAYELVTHMTNAATNVTRALLYQPPPQHIARPYSPAPLVLIGSYLVVLIVLVVLGVCMGRQRHGGNGGSGGGGTRRPKNRQPTPPSGLGRIPDSPLVAQAKDFAAWEEQLRGTSGEHVPDGGRQHPVGSDETGN
jgi:hypothetical protein